MTYSIWPAAKVDQPGQQELFEAANRMEAEGFDPYDEERAYNAAVVRVDADPDLEKYRGVLLETDWNEPEHFEWVATAPKEDLLSWADLVDSGTLNNAEAFEYLDTYLDAACSGDIAGTVAGIGSDELVEMLNDSATEPMPVTAYQFEHYLQRRGYR